MLLQAADKPDRDRQLGWQQTEVQPPYWSNSGSSQSPGRRIKEKREQNYVQVQCPTSSYFSKHPSYYYMGV